MATYWADNSFWPRFCGRPAKHGLLCEIHASLDSITGRQDYGGGAERLWIAHRPTPQEGGPMPMIKTTITVDEDLWRDVRLRSIEEGESAAAIVERAVREEMRRWKATERPPRKSTTHA